MSQRQPAPLHLDARARTQLGAFYTPLPVARRIVEAALDLFGASLPTAVIDPAAGAGAFLCAYAEVARDRALGEDHAIARTLHGLDLDPVAPGLCVGQLADRGFFLPPGRPQEANALKAPWPRERFDLVIGNPPFRNIVRLPAGERATLRERFSTYRNKCDLYGFFLEASLAHLAPGGLLAMICPDSFLGTSSFAPLRELIFSSPERQPRALWTLAPGVFDAAVRPLVLFVEARPPEEGTEIALAHLDARGLLTPRGSLPLAPLASRARRSVALPSDLEALERAEIMEKAGVPLGSLASFSLGVKTSNDARFLADAAEDFPKASRDETRRLFPSVRGRDVQRFQITGERVLDYRPELLRQLHGARPRRPEDFARDRKVLVRETAGARLIVALDDRGRIPLDTLHALWPTEPARCSVFYLLGVLGARPVEWWYAQHHPGSHVKLGELRALPVPAPEGEWRQEIEALARRLSGPLPVCEQAAAQRALDDRVARALGLPGGWRE